VLRDPDRLLTVPEAARRLRQSEPTVYRKVRDGTLPAVKVGLGPKAVIRIPADELERFIFGSSPLYSAHARRRFPLQR
jgi:excisionase family DNA binding protein